jgi:hypothetical protein
MGSARLVKYCNRGFASLLVMSARHVRCEEVVTEPEEVTRSRGAVKA